MYAQVNQGSDKKFYIRSQGFGLHAIGFKDRGQAETIVMALNHAYEQGKKDLRQEMWDVLGLAVTLGPDDKEYARLRHE